MSSPVRRFHFVGSKVTERAMRPSGIVIAFNVLKNEQEQFFKRPISSAIRFLLFKVFEESLTDSVVKRLPLGNTNAALSSSDESKAIGLSEMKADVLRRRPVIKPYRLSANHLFDGWL